MRRSLSLVALTLALAACGSGSGSAGQEALTKGWSGITVDDQFGICSAWKVTPKVVNTAMETRLADLKVTASDVNTFLADQCGK